MPEDAFQIGLDPGRPRHRGVIAHQAERVPVGDETEHPIIARVEQFLQQQRCRASAMGIPELGKPLVYAVRRRCNDEWHPAIERKITDREYPPRDRRRFGRGQGRETEDLDEQLRHEVPGCDAAMVPLAQAIEGCPQRLSDAVVTTDLVPQL